MQWTNGHGLDETGCGSALITHSLPQFGEEHVFLSLARFFWLVFRLFRLSLFNSIYPLSVCLW